MEPAQFKQKQWFFSILMPDPKQCLFYRPKQKRRWIFCSADQWRSVDLMPNPLTPVNMPQVIPMTFYFIQPVQGVL